MNLDYQDEYDQSFKVIVVGDAGTGKTNIVQTFAKGIPPNYTTPTVGVDYYSKNFNVEANHKIKMQIWDTAGQEQYRSIIMGNYKRAVGALVVFDVSSQRSFDNLRRWIYEVRERADEHVVVGVIANKIDLQSRVVSRKDGEDFSNQEQAFYMETTVYDPQTLKNVFQRMAQQIYRSHKNKSLEFSRGNVELKKTSGDSDSCPC